MNVPLTPARIMAPVQTTPATMSATVPLAGMDIHVLTVSVGISENYFLSAAVMTTVPVWQQTYYQAKTYNSTSWHQK